MDRIDKILVQKKYFISREKAAAAVLAGHITVDNQIIYKPGKKISGNEKIEIKEKEKYVSRGGYKLEKALDEFCINPENFICADIGSSTGGFSDCLLQRGARFIYAVDSGTNQLVYQLRQDKRVGVLEKTNARYIDRKLIKEEIDLAVCDLSFISIVKVIPALVQLFGKKKLKIISLIKPEFEAERSMIAKGGLVKKKEHHSIILQKVAADIHDLGLAVTRLDFSPIRGNKSGNIEYLFLIESSDLQTNQSHINEHDIENCIFAAFNNFDEKDIVL